MPSADQIDTNGHPIMRFLRHPAWRLILPLTIAALAFWVLQEMSQDIDFADVIADATSYPKWLLVASFTAMMVSYLSFAMYDVLILPSVTPVKLPMHISLMTAGSSMAVSNMLGFSWLTGAAVRLRVYSAFGIDLSAVAKLIAISWVAFTGGLWAILGLLLLVHPSGMSQLLPISPILPNGEALLGAAMLTGLGVFFWWTRQGPRSIRVGPIKMEVLGAKTGIKLTIVSMIDIVAMAATLYFLMPADLSQDFVYFLIIFAGAFWLGIVSHSPGGLGVFEATLIAGLGAVGRSDVLAAIAIYRVIYTVLPFVIAITGLAIAWVLSNRAQATSRSIMVHRAIEPLVPILAAGLAMLSGVILLISGNLPPDPMRLGFLREILPLFLVETSHLLGSISGVLLLIVARGLYRRMFRAWLFAMVLFGVGLLVSLLKGFDWEEAISLAGAMAILWTFRSAFYRADVKTALKLNWRWVISVTILAGTISWIGFFAYSNVQYSDALWWQVAWKGDASRFLRATLAVTVVLSAFILNLLLSKQSARLKREPIPDIVLQLTQKATHADAGIALSGDKRFIVTDDQVAYIAYADTGSTLVSKGDPVGSKCAAVATIWQLRELADNMGRRCAFYGVSERYLPTYLDLGMQILKIGEVARVKLETFSLEGPKRKDWRHAKARIGREGYHFEVIPAGLAGPDMENLRAVSDAWLKAKNGREKGFSLGWFTPDYLGYFDLAVIRDTETGKITAFANLMKTGDKSEISIDLMRYDPAGPGAAMDALFAEMLLWAKEQGFTWFSLGAAPLSGLENRRLASTWHRVGSFVYENGEPFYQFEGLRSFKQKFDPDWSAEYLATSSRLDAARVLYEVSLLISRGGMGMQQHGVARVLRTLAFLARTAGHQLRKTHKNVGKLASG